MPYEFHPILLAVFWKSGVALGAALCINWMLRNRSADLRRLVFSTTIVAMLVAAAATPVLPRWAAVRPPWVRFQQPASAAVAGAPRTWLVASDDPQMTAPIPLQNPFRRINLETWLIPSIWFAGATILLTRFAINLRKLHRLRRASHAVTTPGLLAAVAHFGRSIRVWRSDAVSTPVTWGIVRPVILVPVGFEELPAESRDAVIRHEVAHIQAHDFLMRGLAEIARALIWFQPLIWIVFRKLREEQELACDNSVLAAGGKPSAYARLLLDWDARRGMVSLVAVGIAHRSCLKRRLYALLDPDLRRDRVAGAQVAGALILALAVALPLAAISLTESEQAAQLSQSQTVQTPATPSAERPRFEVVSVKPCKPTPPTGVPMPAGNSSPGSLRTGCVGLAGSDNTGLIQRAYNRYATGHLTSTKVIPIEGVPDWVHSESFEIDAQMDSHPSQLMMEGPMMQTILEDRFKLKIHRETRQGPVYDLAVGKGPKLKPFQEGTCIPAVMGRPLPVLPDGQRRCRNMANPRGSVDIEAGTIPMFADLLGMILDRPVIDKTGITGYFQMSLTFSPEDPARPVPADPDTPPASKASDAPPISQAIQEQLGLKLVPSKGPMDVLVIDHIERPSGN